MSGEQAANFARRIDSLGYAALWVAEAVGRDPFPLLGYLAAETEKIVLATGIARAVR